MNAGYQKAVHCGHKGNRRHPAPRPKAGDVVLVGPRASVQFARGRGFAFRITTVPPYAAARGWIWLRGYVLDRYGNAVQQREIYVCLAGLRHLSTGPP